MPAHVVIASCEPLPPFDPEHAPIMEALATFGMTSEVVAWDHPDYDWSQTDGVVIRSTWDYHRRREQFVRWAAGVSKVTRLWNPFEIIRWNSHKQYLEELRDLGVRTVPTFWVKRGTRPNLGLFFDDASWTSAVAKPAVSLGAENTIRFSRDERTRAEDHVWRVASLGDVMLQPYLPSVESYGERSLVYLGGAFSHAVSRHPMLSSSAPAEDRAQPVAATREERQAAEYTLGRLRWPWLYARVDLAPGADGVPMLMELELIEPSLFLRHAPQAAVRFAEELKKRL